MNVIVFPPGKVKRIIAHGTHNKKKGKIMEINKERFSNCCGVPALVDGAGNLWCSNCKERTSSDDWTEEDKEVQKRWMRRLGRVKSEKKTLSSRKNINIANENRRKRKEKENEKI